MKRTSFYKSFSDPLIGEYLIQKNSYRNLFLTVLFLVFTYLGSATNYYISNSGDDSNPGTSEAFPWRTLAKVNKSAFKPGDQILLKSGGVWRETLTISSSGNSSSYLVFGSYKTGSKPQILGSEIEKTWKNAGGNLWVSSSPFTDPHSLDNVGNIYFNEKNGDVSWGRIKKDKTSLCVAEYDWTYSDSHIYIYSPSDPNTRYAGVEISQRLNGIELNAKEYITIDGLEIAYMSKSGVNEKYPTIALEGLTIKKCHIHHIGIKNAPFAVGIYANHSNTLIQNNQIHDSGRRNISIFSTGAVSLVAISNITIEDNILYRGFHTTGVDLNNTSTNGTIDDVTIRRNLVYDNLSETLDGIESYASIGMFFANQGGTSVTNLNIYYNIIRNTTASAIDLEGMTGANVYNNTLYGVNANTTSGALFYATRGTTATFKNNIMYVPSRTGTFNCIFVSGTSGAITSDYNLFYNENATAQIIDWDWWRYNMYEWSDYQSEKSQDANSPTPQDPLFVSLTDYSLQANSPAINAGVNIGLPADYQGNPIDGIPDIGAFETKKKRIERSAVN